LQIADLSPNPSSAIVLYESTILLYHISQNIVHLSASLAVKKSSFSLIVHIIIKRKNADRFIDRRLLPYRELAQNRRMLYPA